MRSITSLRLAATSLLSHEFKSIPKNEKHLFSPQVKKQVVRPAFFVCNLSRQLHLWERERRLGELCLQSLLNVLDDVLRVLDTDGKTDKIGADTALNELLVGELTVSGRCGMENARSGIRDVSDHSRKL